MLDAHFRQRVAHGIDRMPHLVGTDRADAPDAKCLDLGELAGIQDEALVANVVVKS